MKKITRKLPIVATIFISAFLLSSSLATSAQSVAASLTSQGLTPTYNDVAMNARNVISSDNSLGVYPNPAADEAKFVFNSSKYNVPYQVRLINNAGSVLTSIQGTTLQGQNTIRIHVGSYPAGTYYIQLLTLEDRETVKLLKQPLNSL
jgi:Secretion system C-terminal sorting domain